MSKNNKLYKREKLSSPISGKRFNKIVKEKQSDFSHDFKEIDLGNGYFKVVKKKGR
jgi:hypothetical protein